ncbi:aminotransferase-like domain-containing protein [Streptococcus ratti]|uniref:PLP-dependent aminotransferase family protein n=1 Tax=Streptococcus ratti TaxID=1341 RepID=A0A7X9LFF5_STRRT|nr:PLP-dependent aminotransferase family protein [Streptococcus ratti]NMD49867.1 PLP-dependent aminotransferase family protein [Streptococcus ratti]
MPVNSFENYPMTWKPDKNLLKTPLYLCLAELLEQDIVTGRLPIGTRLPPQRELADFLDINLSTVTRAFKICTQKGLIHAIIGKGTFVSPNTSLPLSSLKKDKSCICLSVLRPYYQLNHIVSDVSRKLLQSQSVDHLFEFDANQTDQKQKIIAQNWLQNFQVKTSVDNILLTYGTQNALVITFLSLFKDGDKIAVDSFTYTNFIALANQFHIELIALKSDNKGILVEDLAIKVKQHNIKALYLVPTSNNPTAVDLLWERRKKLADITRKNHLLLIEDDTYAFTNVKKIPPFVRMIPQHTIYIHGLSKSLFASLRLAYMVVPDNLRKLFIKTANTLNIHIPLFNAQIVNELIVSGKADQVIERKKLLTKERNTLYRQYFPESASANSYALFQWLPLPKHIDGYAFEEVAKQNGVEVLCAERFFAGSLIDQSAVRIAICSPDTMDELEKGLIILKNLYS